MAKKKESSAADALISSLLDDAKGEDSQSSDSLFSHLSKNAPIGLSPEGVSDVDELLIPDEPEEKFEGPSAGDGSFQSPLSINDPAPPKENDDKTIQLPPTLPGAAAKPIREKNQVLDKIITPKAPAHSVMVQVDASLVQAENLKYAQQRLLELEREVDELRSQNEEISSAAEIVKSKIEELSSREQQLLREKEEGRQNSVSEISILKGQLQFKDAELAKAKTKIEEYENRLKSDFKKVRIRERELENRLELVKAEKATLIRAKDDAILDLKRKTDQLQSEIDNYREKCLELNKTLEIHKEQFKRTARALKLALTNIEAKEDDVIPLKKAE